MIKPFIKWVGGKRQLLPEILKRIPDDFNNYYEPFLGGGAVALNVIDGKTAMLSDSNKELINVYICVRDQLEPLMWMLDGYQKDLETMDRNELYYVSRLKFNSLERDLASRLERAALFIFLNKTCFNGLYRVNSKGEFNTPIGRYKNPKLYDKDDLIKISNMLQNTIITGCDYLDMENLIDYNEKPFVYLDPPYRPLSNTASFTGYSESGFTDDDQKKLCEFCKRISEKGARFLLSNSDPKNTNPDDNFFDDLYKDFKIERVSAKRSINSDGSKRGVVTELLISNY